MKDYFIGVFVGFTYKRIKEILGDKIKVYKKEWP